MPMFMNMLCDHTTFSYSLEECGRYLETIKVYENKSADSIREHMDNDYLSRVCMYSLNFKLDTMEYIWLSHFEQLVKRWATMDKLSENFPHN